MVINRGSAAVLSGSVLVLNRFYMAVHVVSVRRAMVLLYRDHAEVIDVNQGQYFNYDFESWLELSQFKTAELEERPDDEVLGLETSDDYEWIRAPSFQIQVPRIVRLYRYDKIPKLTLRFNRRNLFARDGNQCQYCAKNYPLAQLSFDHVVPRSRGGSTTWENVVCCCLRCNSKKGDRTPEEAGFKLIRKPGKPKQNPLLSVKLDNPKYEVWRSFLAGSSMTMEVV